MLCISICEFVIIIIILNIYTPVSFACDEALKNRGIYFPMKDTGHVTKNLNMSFVNILGLFVTLA